MKPDPNESVVAYTTNDAYEAEIIRNALHAEGIACELDSESQGGFIEIVETKLLVHAWDLDRAAKLIHKRTTDKHEPPRDEPRRTN